MTYVHACSPPERFLKLTKAARLVALKTGFLVDYYNLELWQFNGNFVLYAVLFPSGVGKVETSNGVSRVVRSPALTLFSEDLVPTDYSEEALRGAQ